MLPIAALVAFYGLTLDCSQWTQQSDGAWSAKDAVISGPGEARYRGPLSEIGHGRLLTGGIDVADALQARCAAPPVRRP